MLRFIVEETLAGRGDRLKGVAVAIAVFGRDETFDQQSDPVVRLEARRLRSDLDSYFINAGNQDPVRITIPKGGYVPHFSWQNEDASARMPLPKPKQPDVPPSAQASAASSATGSVTTTERQGSRLLLTATLLALSGVVVLATVFWLRGAGSDSAQARTPAIIVLPFEAFGDIDDIGLIASGVTEELIGNLMLFQDFRVFSANASFRQDAGTDPETLRRELGVAFAVMGVMQSQDGRIYLRAQLVDTETGEVRWSGSYDQPLDAGDLLGAQHDLAVAISTELGEPYGAVNQAIGQRMARDRAPTMPSYTCILRAYDYRQNFDEALYAPAVACLNETVVRDPDYADAWAMLGWLHLDAVRMRIAPEADRPAEMAAALDAAEHAFDLDPDSPRTLAALSAIRFYRGDYAAAEVLQRKVLALNPHDPDTLAQLGWRLAVRGNREGLTYLEQAVARSANAPGWYYTLLSIYAYLDGDYARALDTAEKSTNAVGLSLAAMSHAKLGDVEAARANLEAMAEVWPLLGRDPAAAYRTHHTSDAIVNALVQGLREAGWTPPDADL